MEENSVLGSFLSELEASECRCIGEAEKTGPVRFNA